MDNSLDASGSYRARTGTIYRYVAQGGDWDLDHHTACLFTFVVSSPDRTFEKVIAVEPGDVAGVPPESRPRAARQVAESQLFQKLDMGNEADEPTPLA